MTLVITALLFLVLATASFAVQRTSHRAERPGKWSRTGLLGIGTISTLAMATLMYAGQATIAFLMLAVWLPGMVTGVLLERATYRRR